MSEPLHEIKQILHYTIEMESTDDADEMFIIAKDRLLDINNWHLAVRTNSFNLIDHRGHELHRKAHARDFIKIKFPAEQSADKWFYIEAIEYHDYPDDNLEGMTMVIINTNNPTGSSIIPGNGITCLILERHGIKLTTYYKAEQLNENINWNILLRSLLKTDDD
jgi:hypothetical protein